MRSKENHRVAAQPAAAAPAHHMRFSIDTCIYLQYGTGTHYTCLVCRGESIVQHASAVKSDLAAPVSNLLGDYDPSSNSDSPSLHGVGE